MDQAEIIKLASGIISESALHKTAAFNRDRNLVEDWLVAASSANSEISDLLSNLGFSSSTNVSLFWSRLHSSYATYRAIDDLFVRSPVEMYDAGSLNTSRRTILSLGTALTAADDSFSSSTLEVDPTLFAPFNSKMNDLMNMLYVIAFRRIRRGDSANASYYERLLGITGVSNSQSVSSPTSLQNAWKVIPEAFFRKYNVNVPSSDFVDSYSFIKDAVDKFIDDVYLQNQPTGKKSFALRNLVGFSGYSFDKFWKSIYSKYQNDSEIDSIFQSLIDLDPASLPSNISSPPQDKFYNLGLRSRINPAASSPQISSNLEQLLNLIMSRELDTFLKSIMSTNVLAKGLGFMADTSSLWSSALGLLPSIGRNK